MSIIKYHEYHPIKPLTPGEIRHLRESLGWSQRQHKWQQRGVFGEWQRLGRGHLDLA